MALREGKISKYLISQFKESLSVFLTNCQQSNKPSSHQRKGKKCVLSLFLDSFGPISKADIIKVPVLACLLQEGHLADTG